ncbi:MAG: D-sedoheptulose-7-phosphate isomerase, partial [Lentisphaeria bacterium]
MIELISESYTRAAKALLSVVENPVEISKTVQAAQLIANCFENGGKLLTAGNGGSICDAMHLAEEFTGRFRGNRRALPAIALADSSHITCVANDFGFNEIFSRGIEAFGQSGDIFVGLSTSGNSENIIKAVEESRKKDMKVI